MKADTDTVLDAFGKNEQTRKVFWSVFIALAGLVMARVVDPVTTQTILAAITGAGASRAPYLQVTGTLHTAL
jgi:hypothetical protein